MVNKESPIKEKVRKDDRGVGGPRMIAEEVLGVDQSGDS